MKGKGETWRSFDKGSRRRSAAPTPVLPDIPQLRAKEKKEKGGSVPLYTGAGAGAPALTIGGAAVDVGGSLAMRAGLLGRTAAALARLLGGPASPLGRPFAAASGRWLVGAGLAAWGVVIAAAGLKLLSRPSAAAGALALGTPVFEAMDPTRVPASRRSDRSLQFLNDANKGSLLEKEPAPAAEKPSDLHDAPAAPPVEPVAVLPMVHEPPAAVERKLLRPMAFGASREAAFGAGSLGRIQAGGVSPLDALGRGKSLGAFTPKGLGGAALGKAGPVGRAEWRKAHSALSARPLASLKGRATRAMGQLKLANALSLLGATAPTEQNARALSADAFDQRKTNGGELAGLPAAGIGDGMTTPMGGGAPDLSSPEPPAVPPATNLTPYQNQVDAARGLGEQAAQLKQQGMMMLMMGAMLLMIGIALMAAGAALMAAPPPINLIGIALMAAGAALAAAGGSLISEGMNMLQQAQQMAQQARNQGQGIAQQYGQGEQGAIVGQCAQQSADTGIPVDACAAQNPAGNQAVHTDVQQDVAAERAAGFTLEAGGH